MLRGGKDCNFYLTVKMIIIIIIVFIIFTVLVVLLHQKILHPQLLITGLEYLILFVASNIYRRVRQNMYRSRDVLGVHNQ